MVQTVDLDQKKTLVLVEDFQQNKGAIRLRDSSGFGRNFAFFKKKWAMLSR